MARFEGVEVINLNNNEYELNGADLTTVLESLNIDESKIDLRQDGRTLYIMEKSGTKGTKQLDIWETFQGWYWSQPYFFEFFKLDLSDYLWCCV